MEKTDRCTAKLMEKMGRCTTKVKKRVGSEGDEDGEEVAVVSEPLVGLFCYWG